MCVYLNPECAQVCKGTVCIAKIVQPLWKAVCHAVKILSVQVLCEATIRVSRTYSREIKT